MSAEVFVLTWVPSLRACVKTSHGRRVTATSDQLTVERTSSYTSPSESEFRLKPSDAVICCFKCHQNQVHVTPQNQE